MEGCCSLQSRTQTGDQRGNEREKKKRTSLKPSTEGALQVHASESKINARQKKRCSERKDEKEKIRLPTEPALYLLSVVLRTCCTRSHKTEGRGRGWVSDDSEGKNEND